MEDKEKLFKIFENAYSKSDVIRALGLTLNGTGGRKVDYYTKLYNIDTSHFCRIKSRKYERIIKRCPICNEEFVTKKGHSREKTTCSHSCSNTYFRSYKKNGRYKGENYRLICFHYHKKECIICNEKNIVAVHHYDKDTENNKPENLIPMCPTHHQYMHSAFKKLIIDKVEKYRNDFIKNISSV